MSTENDKRTLRTCACRYLLMTSRVITQYFDKAFQSLELSAAQFSLLGDISSREKSTVGQLADALLMDQTTVTRNIENLRKNGLIVVVVGEDDSRKRYISITEKGSSKLTDAIPLWEKAQKRIEAGIGKERYTEFLNILADIQDMV